jgi:hypothetical protein
MTERRKKNPQNSLSLLHCLFLLCSASTFRWRTFCDSLTSHFLSPTIPYSQLSTCFQHHTTIPSTPLRYSTIGNIIIIMMRLTTLLIVLLGSSTAAAYTVSPQRSSYFVGHSVYHTTAAAAPQTSSSRVTSSSNLTMKKGKANVPPQMRSQYARAQEMENYRQQMMESQRMGADGLPVFNLYVRTSLKNVSYVACCLYLHIRIIIILLLRRQYSMQSSRCYIQSASSHPLLIFLATKTTCYYAILLLYKIIINHIRT